MKKIIILITCLLLSSTICAKSILNIHQWKTSNGIRVLFVRAPQIPMLDVAVVFKAGSIYDAGHFGLATLTNAMLNEGAGTFNVDKLANQFDNVGANFSNTASKETSVFMLRTLVKPTNLNAALNTFGLILNNPSFPASSVQRIKQQMLVGLNAAKQQPDYLAAKAFSKAIWGQHPYAYPTEGNEKTVANLTEAEVKAFYNRYYVAQNAMIVMVGDVSQVQAHVIASRLLGKLPAGVPAVEPTEASANQAAKQHIDFPSSQNSIMIGTLGISRRSPDYLPLTIGNYIFGGGSFSSILMKNVREKYGLTYGVYSRFSALTERGAFLISLKSRNDKAQRASNMVQDYLAQFMANGPTKAQLTAAKNYLLGSFPLNISSNSQILSAVMDIGYYHLPLDYLDTYRARVKAVTVTQIKTAFNDTLNLKNLVVVSVGGKGDAKQ